MLVSSRRRALSHLVLAAVLAFGAAAGAARPARAQSYGTDQRYCDRSALGQVLSTSRGNLVGSAAGAALGGLLGSKMGKGSGQTVLTIAGILGGALAGGYIGRSMDPADQACVGKTLENAPTNQTVTWQNPDNGSSYWVTPTSTYTGQNGQPCRNYVTQAVVNGQTQRNDGTACRDQSGAWTPVSTGGASPPPRAAAPPPAPSAVSQDTILKVQQKLHDLGFYVRDNIDGRWGPNTRAAVQNFQRTRGMTPSGQLDVQTLSALGLSNEAASQ